MVRWIGFSAVFLSAVVGTNTARGQATTQAVATAPAAIDPKLERILDRLEARGRTVNDLACKVEQVMKGLTVGETIVKKGALYSALGAILIFAFSFLEEIFVSYLTELIGGHSQIMHFLSLAVILALLMPVKTRLEHLINRTFADRKLEF